MSPQTVRGAGGEGESTAGSKVVTRAKAGEKQRNEYPEDTLVPEGVENQRRTPSTLSVRDPGVGGSNPLAPTTFLTFPRKPAELRLAEHSVSFRPLAFLG